MCLAASGPNRTSVVEDDKGRVSQNPGPGLERDFGQGRWLRISAKNFLVSVSNKNTALLGLQAKRAAFLIVVANTQIRPMGVLSMLESTTHSAASADCFRSIASAVTLLPATSSRRGLRGFGRGWAITRLGDN